MKQLVIFDLDGTLANTLPLCNEAFTKAIGPYVECLPNEDELRRASGRNEAGMAKSIVGEGWEQALQDFYTLYERMHPSWCPTLFDGIRELLEELKEAGVTLALITGKGDFTCHVSLRQFGLTEAFEHIVTGGFERNMKSEQIRALLERCHLKPANAVYVGDAVSDVLSCRAAGVECLSVAWAPTADVEALRQVNASRVVETVEALRKCLMT